MKILKCFWCYLSVVKFEGGVVVVRVVVHSLVHYSYMTIDLLSPFIQRPVLPTLPSIALLCPAAQSKDTSFTTLLIHLH